MALTSEQKKSILSEFGLHETDTGSPEAQIALLTNRINNLTEHLKFHKSRIVAMSFCEPRSC